MEGGLAGTRGPSSWCSSGCITGFPGYLCPAESHLASNGALRVNEHLQVEGCSRIYAIGDCADVKEPKMAYHAGLHASVAVANIVNSMKQRPLKAYKPGKEAACTSETRLSS